MNLDDVLGQLPMGQIADPLGVDQATGSGGGLGGSLGDVLGAGRR
jgi:hypothetical protein